jgi:hypothetical protein
VKLNQGRTGFRDAKESPTHNSGAEQSVLRRGRATRKRRRRRRRRRYTERRGAEAAST